jgi:hypothetical protein
MGDDIAFEAALVIEVEVLEGLAGGEPGGPDAQLAAVGLAGGDLAFETGGQELLMGPVLGSGPLGEPVDGLGQLRSLECPAQVGEIGRGLGGGGHHATPPMWSYTVRSRCSTRVSVGAAMAASARMARRMRACPGASSD